MYLTKLEMPLQSRKAAGAVADCQKMHQLIAGLFAAERKEQNLLYRMRIADGRIQIYLYSAEPPTQLPSGMAIVGQRDLSSWLQEMEEKQLWGFDLLTMPSKKVYQSERGKNSQRRVLRLPEERVQWLQRKAEQNGFMMMQVQELEQSCDFGRHRPERGGAMYWNHYHYQGTLQIINAEKFRKALSTGIGPGKAYGLGMLLLRSI